MVRPARVKSNQRPVAELPVESALGVVATLAFLLDALVVLVVFEFADFLLVAEARRADALAVFVLFAAATAVLVGSLKIFGSAGVGVPVHDHASSKRAQASPGFALP